MRSRAPIVAFSLVCACGPGLAGNGEGSESSGETGAEGSEGDGGTGDGDGDSGDGDGDSGDGDGDSGDGDGGDGDADTGSPCENFEVPCPDDTCQIETLDGFQCCGHGGPCAEGCEPQEVEGDDPCDEPLYAWAGQSCRAICDCVGPDCGELYASVSACLGDHDPACGVIGLDTCPFEMVLGPTMVSGTTSQGEVSFEVGAFGQVFGKGGMDLNIYLATDALTLGNYLFNFSEYPESAQVLQIFVPGDQVGEYMVSVSQPVPLSDFAMGTLTLETVDLDGAGYQDYGLAGQLEVSEDEWQLQGAFAIPGCQVLELHLP